MKVKVILFCKKILHWVTVYSSKAYSFIAGLFCKNSIRWVAVCFLKLGLLSKPIVIGRMYCTWLMIRFESWATDGITILFPLSIVLFGHTFIEIATLFVAIDDFTHSSVVDLFDAFREFIYRRSNIFHMLSEFINGRANKYDVFRELIYGRTNTITIKTNFPAILPHEIVRTPELEKAIATCNKEGLSVVQASPVPNKSNDPLYIGALTFIFVVGVELLWHALSSY